MERFHSQLNYRTQPLLVTVVDAFSPAADKELKILHDKFTIDVKPAHFFLGNNISVHL